MSALTFTVVTKKNRRPQGSRYSQGNRTQGEVKRRPQSKQRKPFCKVCFDSDKTEQEYTNHYLKDKPGPNGKVICPTLLATECRYCHDLGHFKSHCPILAERKVSSVYAPSMQASFVSDETFERIKEAEANITLRQRHIKQKPAQIKRQTNTFSALESDDDEDVKVSAGPAVVAPKPVQGQWTTALVSTETAIPSDDTLFALKRAHTLAPEKDLVTEKTEVEQAREFQVAKAMVKAASNATKAGPQILWGDIPSDDETASDDEEEIAHDNSGRPETDNSAW